MNAPLSTELRALESDMNRRFNTVEANIRQRHEENMERFAKLEKFLIEASVYFKLGRWTMNLLAAIFGGMAAATLLKWTGTKP